MRPMTVTTLRDLLLGLPVLPGTRLGWGIEVGCPLFLALYLAIVGLDGMCWQPTHLQSLPARSALAPKLVQVQVPLHVGNALTQSRGRACLRALKEYCGFSRLLSLSICNLYARAYSISCDAQSELGKISFYTEISINSNSGDPMHQKVTYIIFHWMRFHGLQNHCFSFSSM